MLIYVAALPVLHAGQDPPLRRDIAAQLVGHDHAGDMAWVVEQLAAEPLRGCGIAPALDQDVEYTPMQVHRAPEIVHLAADREEHLIQVPLVARVWLTPLQGIGEQPAEARALRSNSLVADHHAIIGQDGPDVAQAEAEAVIEPDRCWITSTGKRKPRLGPRNVVMLETVP